MITVPSLDPCTDILDTDKIMITHSNGTTETISGTDFNKRTQIISASSKTITGTPLKTGNPVRVFFTADITGSDTTTALVINYNGTNYNVKVPKDGSLVNFTAQNMGGSPVVYKYLQAYTELELYYDGTQFVIVGNPVVISDGDYIIYADRSMRLKNCEVSTNPKVIGKWHNGKNIYRKLVTHEYTAGDNLGFSLNNVVNNSQLIKNVELFTGLFNLNRYQFFSNGQWEGNWSIHFYHMDRNLSIKLESSYEPYSFTIYAIIDYIEN